MMPRYPTPVAPFRVPWPGAAPMFCTGAPTDVRRRINLSTISTAKNPASKAAIATPSEGDERDAIKRKLHEIEAARNMSRWLATKS
jgi:hypothetical protein